MHEHPPCLLLQLVQALEDVSGPGRLEVDRRAVCLCGPELDLACALVHDDERVGPLERSAEGERRRVVSGRRRDHASSLLLGGERGELREYPSGLEGARALEELGLQKDVRPQRSARQRGRSVETAGDDSRCALHVLATDRQRPFRAIVRNAKVSVVTRRLDSPGREARRSTRLYQPVRHRRTARSSTMPRVAASPQRPIRLLVLDDDLERSG